MARDWGYIGPLRMWRYWHKPSYWRWWWHTEASLKAKALLVLAGTALVGLAGYAAATRSLTSARASWVEVTTTRSVDVKRKLVTVSKLVTVRKDGRIRRKLVPVVRRVVVRGPAGVVTVTTVRTSDHVSTLTAPGAMRPPEGVDGSTGTVSVRPPIVITTRGTPMTVTAIRIVNRPQTVTARQVVTNQQTVVAPNTVTQQADVVTVTRTATQTQTQTVAKTATETQTVAVTTTVPVTTSFPVTTTVTRTTTVTDTVPLTVTATVTVPVTVIVPPPHH